MVSAFIKSIRASDPNAAVYYLARMVEGGEDPKFIARRLLISASEDIGNANPTALVLANNTFAAVERIGWPEARIVLSQCAVFGHQPQEQRLLQGHWAGTAVDSNTWGSGRALGTPQRPDQAHEGLGLWERLRLRP